MSNRKLHPYVHLGVWTGSPYVYRVYLHLPGMENEHYYIKNIMCDKISDPDLHLMTVKIDKDVSKPIIDLETRYSINLRTTDVSGKKLRVTVTDLTENLPDKSTVVVYEDAEDDPSGGDPD